MPSRQMAFQISELEIHDLLTRFAKGHEALKGKSAVQVIDEIEQDPKVREKFRAVLVMSIRCEKEGKSCWNIRKIICWRGPDGKPGQLEAEWKNAS